jgi:hypothetical protein
MELLDKSVSPTERLYRRAMSMTPPKATTIMTRTRLGFGGLHFSPFEVLGVNLDEASVRRAELLGFKAEALSPSAQKGTRIVRLILPPSLDAIRGQEFLSREMPGHRFELNKIYRLCRAAMILRTARRCACKRGSISPLYFHLFAMTASSSVFPSASPAIIRSTTGSRAVS